MGKADGNAVGTGMVSWAFVEAALLQGYKIIVKMPGLDPVGGEHVLFAQQTEPDQFRKIIDDPIFIGAVFPQ